MIKGKQGEENSTERKKNSREEEKKSI